MTGPNPVTITGSAGDFVSGVWFLASLIWLAVNVRILMQAAATGEISYRIPGSGEISARRDQNAPLFYLLFVLTIVCCAAAIVGAILIGRTLRT